MRLRGQLQTPHFETYDVFAAHNVECQIYDFLRNENAIPIAKTWFTQQSSDGHVGVIMMADLAKDGVNLEFATSFSLQQVRFLGSYHCTSHIGGGRISCIYLSQIVVGHGSVSKPPYREPSRSDLSSWFGLDRNKK